VDQGRRRQLGIVLIVLGAIAMTVGLIGMISSGDGDTVAVTTTAGATTTSSTTTSAPTTTTTTTTATTSTTSSTTTTTTVAVPDLIGGFADMFRDSLDGADGTFAFETLHPVVVSTFGEELCRAYVDREVVLIRDYTLTGPIEGPTPRVFETSGGEVTVDVYTAPVTFTFQGQQVDTTGAFAIVDGEVRWFTECR
jgi:hypothetical protein